MRESNHSVMHGTPSSLILHLIRFLETEDIPSVYLRNHEQLPESVGNDVDLLIPRGRSMHVSSILKREARQQGWCFLGAARFGELSLYFANPENAGTLHVDLYDRFCWHGIKYADEAGVMARRQWNGNVFIPDVRDELYLNIGERLIYAGSIREKHQLQAGACLVSKGMDFVTSAFERHLGSHGRDLAGELIHRNWQGSTPLRNRMRRLAFLKHGLPHPLRLLGGILGYGWRILTKMARPPGRFLVFEGADGVGKSTVMEAVIPWCASWCAGRDPYDFHWKPTKLHTGERAKPPSVDPRAKRLRGPAASFVFLLYHLTGFWWGWLVRIYPLLIQSHVVAGDRYSYDMFLDPRRFRLGLPSWLCKLAALAAPGPDCVIGLVASPEVVYARKPELSIEEIRDYQERWRDLARDRKQMLEVSADGSVDEVIQRVKCGILRMIATDS